MWKVLRHILTCLLGGVDLCSKSFGFVLFGDVGWKGRERFRGA